VSYQARRIGRRLLGLRLGSGRVSFRTAVRKIHAAFAGEPHAPHDIRRKAGAAGEDDTIELAFISPEVGARYQEKIGELSYTTGWFLMVYPRSDEEEIIRTAQELLAREGIAGEVCFVPEAQKIAVTCEEDTGGRLQAVTAALTHATGCALEIRTGSPSHA
jgi:hypothetical protein